MGTCGGGGRAGGLLPASLRKLEAKSSAQSEAGARGGGRRKYSRLVEKKKGVELQPVIVGRMNGEGNMTCLQAAIGAHSGSHSLHNRHSCF